MTDVVVCVKCNGTRKIRLDPDDPTPPVIYYRCPVCDPPPPPPSDEQWAYFEAMLDEDLATSHLPEPKGTPADPKAG
jgi:hypothetical protein